MNKALSVFDWQGRPSLFAKDPLFASKQQGGAGMPAKERLLRYLTGSIATPEKTKQRPGVGKSRTN